MGRFRKILLYSISVIGLLSWPGTAFAQQYSSPHYAVNEIHFGSGGGLSGSTNYSSESTVGEMTAGKESGGQYSAQAGFNTNRQPSLTFVVHSTNINLGVLSPNTTTTATATFSVKSYLSSGYVVTTVSNPPQNGKYYMKSIGSPTQPSSFTNNDEFGINLVANTSPKSFGANPVQIPDSTFSYGAAAANYNQPNFFTYHKGDIIAQSTKSSGETDYTISYVFHVSSITPGGTYTFSHVLVATPTF